MYLSMLELCSSHQSYNSKKDSSFKISFLQYTDRITEFQVKNLDLALYLTLYYSLRCGKPPMKTFDYLKILH